MPSQQPINILLVDDRSENLLALEALLSPLGYNLVLARSGEEALRCVLHYDFAVILLDVQMPAMDGFETAELIRGRERSRDTPIIFLTAVSTSELHISRGYIAGAVDYLLKPFMPEILLSKVAIFVDLYAKTAQVREQAQELQATIGSLKHEIAERQRVEAELRHASDELERRVAERTAGLAEANQALRAEIAERHRLEVQLIQSQKMESIGRLAGGIAHDFNNLLMAISGYAELAIDALPPDHYARDDLDEIRKAAARAAGLTQQLLAFARKQIMDPRVIHLTDLVRDVEKLLQRLIGADIEIVLERADDLGYVRADFGQIEQLLINLAVNARDAMPDGGQLTIQVGNVVLDAHDASAADNLTPGAYVRLSVSDTGAGMDLLTQAHLFEPFFTTKERGRGTGLGLATCYGIVKQHAGHIACVSAMGKGTTFDVYLPCVDEQPDELPLSPQQPDLPGGDERVLLVEDEAAVRSLLARMLRDLGYNVAELSNGEEALQYVQAHTGERFDLLLTDVVMPRMGGEKLAEQLKAIDPVLKVLFISGYADSATIAQGRLQSDMLVLTKPFEQLALARRVREALDR
ncbi:MAG TPA: response regulator [Roseiflexaceae bacterium]|nr:response regulator [Roseiflexaceae bacterium]